jgi:hypothetical protein
MSKDYKNIDQLFKDELGSLQPKAPSHIKKKIDEAVRRKKRRRFLFFIIPIVAVTATLTTFYFSSNNNSENSHINSEFVSNSVETSENISSEAGNKKNETNPNTASNNELESSTNGDSNNAKSENYSKMDMTSNKSNVSNVSIDNSTTKDPTKNINSDRKTRNIRTFDKFENSKIVSNDQSSENQISENSNNNNVQDSDEKSDTDNGLKENEVTTDRDKNEDTNIETDSDKNIDLVENTSSDSSEIIQYNPSDSIKADDSTNVSENNLSENSDTTSVMAEEPEHDLNPSKDNYKGWMLGITGGVKTKSSKITGANDSTNQLYANSLNDRVGYGIGINLNYRLKNSLLFGGGVEYSSYSENYDYQKSITTIADSTILWNVFISDSTVDSTGTTYIYDSTSTTNYTYANQVIYDQQGKNQTTYLHIPFRFGAQIIRNKWRFDGYLQGRFNLLLKSNATFVVNDALVTSSLKSSYFDLEIGAGIHYNFWKDFYLTGTLRYRPPLKNPYYSTALINRMQYLYLGGGISFNF